MTRPTPLPGIWPALLTPLTEALDIDHRLFATHAKALVDAGCGGVTPFGTTGEGTAFSVAERIAAVDAIVAGGVPAAKVLVSTSCAALPDTVAPPPRPARSCPGRRSAGRRCCRRSAGC